MVWFLKSISTAKKSRRARSGELKEEHGQGSASSCCSPTESRSDGMESYDHSSLSRLFEANQSWAKTMREEDPQFFELLSHQQSPEFLWIGCSDSRVPANQILGLAPGEIFVQRNVGNQALHTDMNLMSCLEYAVKSLKVKTVIVCGHYGCGAVRAALELPSRTPGLVNCWISDIREARNQAATELAVLSADERVSRLCELNVLRQVFHVCTSPVVQSAWAEGQELHVWGIIYDLHDGLIRRLAGPFTATSEVDDTLEHFVDNDAKVVRCPATNKLQVHAVASPDNASGSNSSSAGSPHATPRSARATPPLPGGALRNPSIRTQVTNANILNAVIRHTTWSADDGEHTGERHTLAGAARAGGAGGH